MKWISAVALVLFMASAASANCSGGFCTLERGQPARNVVRVVAVPVVAVAKVRPARRAVKGVFTVVRDRKILRPFKAFCH